MKNEYEIRGNEAIIFLNRRDGTILKCLIDAEDLHKAQSFEGKWYAHKSKLTGCFYVYGNQKKEKGYATIKLHSWILDTPTGMLVDHVNGNTLDNRRFNIRNITKGQNNQNVQGAYKRSSSGIRGVTWNKARGKWCAQMMVNGKQKHIGLFNDIAEAEKAVKEYRAKYMPYSQEALT